jgi:phosphoglycolate phosphatase-like HAD superfamily hydrolase
MIQALLDYHIHDKIVMVGDTTFDIKTGKNAKVNTIAVTYGYEPNIKDSEIQADLYIDDFAEIVI